MASIFTKIIAGEIPAYKIAENEFCYAFLDINPIKRGHTLVVPKQEVDYLFDLEETRYLALQSFAKEIAKAIEKVVPCERIGVAVIGLEVPHAHIHLIPINSIQDLNFSQPRISMDRKEFESLANQISNAL